MKQKGKRLLGLICAATLVLGTATYPSFAGETVNTVETNPNHTMSEEAENGAKMLSTMSQEKEPVTGNGETDASLSESGLNPITEASAESTETASPKKAGNSVRQAAKAPAAVTNTVAAPGAGEHLSDELHIPVGEDGLPTKGLLVRLTADEETDPDDDPETARLFIRFNPCGLKAHNSQPSNYNDGALCVAEYLFEKDGNTYTPIKKGLDETSGRTAAAISGDGSDYQIRKVESYGDTADLWHAFVLTPDEADVAAFVPMGIDQNVYTGAASRFCMRYEAALEDEQNWKIDGRRKISGGYLASGEGAAAHNGKAQESLDVSVIPQTGGLPVEAVSMSAGKENIYNAGLTMDVHDLPDGGLPGRLVLRLTPPGEFQNGEGGFGFVSTKTYREAWPHLWRMPIEGKSGFRVCIQRWTCSTNKNGTKSWGEPENGRRLLYAEVPSAGTEIDLSSMNIAAGDRLTVTPCRADLGGMTTNNVDDHNLFDTDSVRFFHFKWSLSAENADMTVTSGDTAFKEEDDAFRAESAVDNAVCPVQHVDVSVKDNGQKAHCGIGEDQLPNYGLHIYRDDNDWSEQSEEDESPRIRIFPQDTAKVCYAAEWYKKENGRYSCVHREAVRTDDVTLVRAGGSAEKGQADVLVVRRIFPKNERQIPNTFTAFGEDPEMMTSSGRAVCPQTGKEQLRIVTKRTELGGMPHYFFRQKLTNRDTGEAIAESPNDGAIVELDLSDEARQILRVDVDYDESEEVLRDNPETGSTEPGFEGLPPYALVIKHIACDKDSVSSTVLPQFNVNLGLPKGADATKVSAHLYRYSETKKRWEKVSRPEDSSDWINAKDGGNLDVGLSSDWSYGLHAHLKDQEAIVVMPKSSIYEISYAITIANHADFDVVKDKTRYPAETFHPNRHYFYGMFKNENFKAKNGGVMIEIGTAHKNVDAEDGKGTATVLTNVRPLKVNLFDYDFGTKDDFILSRQNQQFHFSYDPRNTADTEVNTWHDREYTGIVKAQLGDDGLPVFTYSTPFEETGISLFDLKEVPEAMNGGTKKVYPAVDFDFIYDQKTRTYSYTSGTNAACFDGSGHIRQYSAPIGLDGWDEKSAGFFPFNSFSQKGHWGTKLKNNLGVYALDPDKTIDYHFGMSMSHDFYIPDDRKTEDGRDLIFKLSADDDAWLFIDGRLAMDLGGIHEACDGVMNLTKGTCQVGSTMSPWNTAGDYQAPKTRTGSVSEDWLKPGKHTFSIFYLERGSTLSDLTINFNLPLEKKTEIVNTGGRGIKLVGIIGTLTALGGGAWLLTTKKKSQGQ